MNTTRAQRQQFMSSIEPIRLHHLYGSEGMNVKLTKHSKERLLQRFNIKTELNLVNIKNLKHLHNDKYLYNNDTVFIIKNETLLTVYPRS